MSVLTAYAQDVKRTLDEVKTMFFEPSSTFLLLNPEATKRNKWTLLEKKFHLLQIEIEKQQLVEELGILSKERPRKASPKSDPGLNFDCKKSNGFAVPPPNGWGPKLSPKKETSPPPPPKVNEAKAKQEEPKKS